MCVVQKLLDDIAQPQEHHANNMQISNPSRIYFGARRERYRTGGGQPMKLTIRENTVDGCGGGGGGGRRWWFEPTSLQDRQSVTMTTTTRNSNFVLIQA